MHRELSLSEKIVSLVILIIIIFAGYRHFQTNNPQEIENIKKTHDTALQTKELEKLLERVGPLKTQELMYQSGLPFTGETHLLIHTIGDYIYDHYGLDGLGMCKEYFLSACYHGFIINALAEYGMNGVVKAMEKCSEAGSTVFGQCAHATGHGFLAWHDYNLLKALKMCDELGGKVENFAFFNCYDGVFMENFWGVHNGAPSEKRWIKDDDYNYPCDDPRIPEKYLNGCWSNQATVIYQHFNGDLKKTAEACDAVTNPDYRETCYNNFSRQIHPLTQGDKKKVFELCLNATGKAWQDYCVITNAIAYWSVGDKNLPQEICQSADDPLKSQCLDKIRLLK